MASSFPPWERAELSAYLKIFRKRFPVLPQEAFNSLLAEYRRTGARRIHDRLVYSNIGLAAQVAWKHPGGGFSLLDMTQEGILGIMRAIELFEPERGHTFGTYAYPWIEQHINRALIDAGSRAPFRIPVHMHERIQLARKAFSKFCRQHQGRVPNDYEVYLIAKTFETEQAKKLTMWRTVQAMKFVRLRLIEMDRPVRLDDDGSKSLGDLIASEIPEETGELASTTLAEDCRNALDRILLFINDEMLPRHATVLRSRFPLDGSKPMTLEQTAEILGLTRERTRQIQTRALSLLEQRLGVDEQLLRLILDIVQEPEAETLAA